MKWNYPKFLSQRIKWRRFWTGYYTKHIFNGRNPIDSDRPPSPLLTLFWICEKVLTEIIFNWGFFSLISGSWPYNPLPKRTKTCPELLSTYFSNWNVYLILWFSDNFLFLKYKIKLPFFSGSWMYSGHRIWKDAGPAEREEGGWVGGCEGSCRR